MPGVESAIKSVAIIVLPFQNLSLPKLKMGLCASITPR